MDAGKCQGLHILGRAHNFGLVVSPYPPAAKPKLLVEEQVSGRLSGLHCQCGQSLMFIVRFHHATEINGAEDIDIVQNKGLCRRAGILEKKPRGLS